MRGCAYFGCFFPNAYLTSKTAKDTKASLGISANICIPLCVTDAMEFTTVQGNKSYCLKDAPAVDTATNECNQICPVTLSEFCSGTGTGNNEAMSVYEASRGRRHET